MHYKIKAIGWLFLVICISCEDILEETDISNKQVRILAPSNGSTVTVNVVNFNWDIIEDATSYKVQIAVPNFENTVQILLDSLVKQDSLGLINTKLQITMLNGSYEWRVKAKNTGFETEFTNSAFVIDGDENADFDPPNIPQLVAPANGVSQDETEVNFSWSRTDVPGTAERDSIYIYTDENLESLETIALGSNKTYVTTLATGTFYWRVKAFDGYGNESDTSNTFNVTIN